MSKRKRVRGEVLVQIVGIFGVNYDIEADFHQNCGVGIEVIGNIHTKGA